MLNTRCCVFVLSAASYAAAITATGCGSETSAESAADTEDTPATVTAPTATMTAEEFTREFSANAESAKDKYKGKRIQLDGEVVRTRTSVNRAGMVVVLKGAFEDQPFNRRYRVTCTFPDQSPKSLQLNQRVRVEGLHRGIVIGSVISLGSCRLVVDE